MSADKSQTRDHLLSDQQYFLLNSLAVIVLPALGTLYFALAQIWGLPAGEQVVGSIVAVDTFLGVVVKVGEMSYNNSNSRYAGAINVSEQPDKTVYSLDLNHDPAELKNMDSVSFKVNTPKENPKPALQVPFPTPPASSH
jgi:hypothetical protein